MRTPFEFGHDVGTLTKQAGWAGDLASGTKSLVLGDAGIGTQVADPTQRGLAADIALYSNPFTGVATGVNDMSRHLYNGRYGSALGSLGMTALSFLPGVGGALGKTIAKGVRGAGKVIGSPALMRGAAGARQFATAGGRVAQNANNAAARGIQKIVPVNPATTSWTRKAINAGVKNPAAASTVVGPIGGAMLGQGMPPAASAVP